MANRNPEPSFGSTNIQNRSDGYWITAFKFHEDDIAPGLIVSGLNSGVVQFLENPRNKVGNATGDGGWEPYDIGEFDTPVAIIAVDITGNGYMDVVVCHDFGPTMLECNSKGGWVSWLENPGREKLKERHWEKKSIGRWPAMHRLAAGFFTQRSFLEIIGAPVVHGPHDKTTAVPIICFRAPVKPRTANEWRMEIADDKHFTVVHEIVSKRYQGPNTNDSLLVASREGLSWLFFDQGRWHHKVIDQGVPRAPGQSPTTEQPGSGDHWGCGTIDAGRIGNDPFAYIATMDPFHGPVISVYTKIERGLEGIGGWKRHVLDVYGTPWQRMKYGHGPGHFLTCGDFDGDGDDEFVVSLIGRVEGYEGEKPSGKENPDKGILYFKAMDLDNGIFAKWKIATESSARIATGDFNGTGKIDLASIGYNVKQYYEEPNPSVTLHLNQTTPLISLNLRSQKRSIVPSLWDDEGIVYLSDPRKIAEPAEMNLIDIANIGITVKVYPPGYPVEVGSGGVKVLYGTLKDGNNTRRPLGGKPFPEISSTLSDSPLKADEVRGAIVIHMIPTLKHQSNNLWPKAADVPIKTRFDLSDAGLTMPELNFKKMESLWWGDHFKGIEFYNLRGFNFRLLESKDHIAHMQFWSAGTGVSARAHDHRYDMFEEIHITLSPGTIQGGMRRILPEYEHLSEEEAEASDAYEHRILPLLYEHGAIWHQDRYGRPVRGKDNVVSYPWHKWQAGEGANVDVWLALEFNPDISL